MQTWVGSLEAKAWAVIPLAGKKKKKNNNSEGSKVYLQTFTSSMWVQFLWGLKQADYYNLLILLFTIKVLNYRVQGSERV